MTVLEYRVHLMITINELEQKMYEKYTKDGAPIPEFQRGILFALNNVADQLRIIS